MDWTIAVGIAGGIGLPTMTGLFMLVRMENRISTLEKGRDDDNNWVTSISTKLDAISKDLNQLIGGNTNNHDEIAKLRQSHHDLRDDVQTLLTNQRVLEEKLKS